MKILGIDPGLAETGIGVVHGHGLRVDGFAFGSIATSQKEEQSKRLEKIYTKLLGVLKKEMPDLMVVELSLIHI